MGQEKYRGVRWRSEAGDRVWGIGGFIGCQFSAGLALGERSISSGDRRERRELRARWNAGGYGTRRCEIFAGRVARKIRGRSVEDGRSGTSRRRWVGCAEQRFGHLCARQ